MELEQQANDDLTGYEELTFEEEESQDKTVEEGAEDSRFDLQSKFDRSQNLSQIATDENGMPLVENELSQLTATNASQVVEEKDYAEFNEDESGDILDIDNYNEELKDAYMQSDDTDPSAFPTTSGPTSQHSATLLSKKYEASGPKDPEEEYFRLVSHKLIKKLSNQVDLLLFTELFGT